MSYLNVTVLPADFISSLQSVLKHPVDGPKLAKDREYRLKILNEVLAHLQGEPTSPPQPDLDWMAIVAGLFNALRPHGLERMPNIMRLMEGDQAEVKRVVNFAVRVINEEGVLLDRLQTLGARLKAAKERVAQTDEVNLKIAELAELKKKLKEGEEKLREWPDFLNHFKDYMF